MAMRKVKKVLFMGSKHLGLQVLREIFALSPETLIGILTIDDSSDTRTVLGDFQGFSCQKDLVLHVAKNRRHAEEIVYALKPDLCLVVGWYWLISNAALNSVPSGFIGIHNSLLPKYRGGSPLIWSVINNDKKVGCSFFSFTQGMDEGAIWVQGSIRVEQQDYISDILKKFEEKTIQVLQANYLKILYGDLKPTEQDHTLATYCAQRFPLDGNINWSNSAQDVYNFIRAQSNPYPGAFTYFDAQELTIWSAVLFDKPYYGTPGQVARIAHDGVYVICGDDRAILIKEVGRNGKKSKANAVIKSIKARMYRVKAGKSVPCRSEIGNPF